VPFEPAVATSPWPYAISETPSSSPCLADSPHSHGAVGKYLLKEPLPVRTQQPCHRGWPGRGDRPGCVPGARCLAWAGQATVGCWLGQPRRPMRPIQPGRCSGLQGRGHCGFGLDRACYCSSFFFNFQNPVILSIFRKLVPNSKIRRNLHTIQKIAK
jgi:hypothetical protein